MTKQSNSQLDRLKHAAYNRRIIGAAYRPLCKIFILIGIATIGLAMAIAWQYNSSTKRTELATGTITEINRVSGVGKDSDGGSTQKCRIHYVANINGDEYTDRLGYRGEPTTDKCNLTIGSTIDISYDPAHPLNNAYLVDDQTSDHGTLKNTVISSLTITAVGAIPLVVGIIGLQIDNKRNEDKLEVMNSKSSKEKHLTKQKEK